MVTVYFESLSHLLMRLFFDNNLRGGSTADSFFRLKHLVFTASFARKRFKLHCDALLVAENKMAIHIMTLMLDQVGYIIKLTHPSVQFWYMPVPFFHDGLEKYPGVIPYEINQ